MTSGHRVSVAFLHAINSAKDYFGSDALASPCQTDTLPVAGFVRLE